MKDKIIKVISVGRYSISATVKTTDGKFLQVMDADADLISRIHAGEKYNVTVDSFNKIVTINDGETDYESDRLS